LESLANQLAALTGVSAATWLKPGTFTGPLDKAANLQNLIAAIGIWNALKAKPAEALNAIKTGLPNLWNSITNAFKNNPLAAWGTAIGTTIAALLGGYTAICGLSSTLSMLHLAGFVFLPLTGALTTNKKQRVYGILVGMLMLGMVLSACGGTSSAPEIPQCATAPSTNTPAPTPTQTMTPLPPTATLTPVPTQSPCTKVLDGEGLYNVAGRLGVHIGDLNIAPGAIVHPGDEVCWKTPPPPIPADAITFSTEEEDISCLEIAAIHGVSLKELENANANRAYTDGQNDILVIDWNVRDENRQPKCTIQPNAHIVVPYPTLLSIPEAVQKYPCAPNQGRKCLDPNASMEEVLQYVLYNEGGSTDGPEFSANVMQVMVNRTNRLLAKWGKSRESMSREEYASWLLHVISMPADADETAPAFEAFFRASEPVDLNSEIQSNNWNYAAQTGQAILDGQSLTGEASDKIDSDVQFYCSDIKGSPAPEISYALLVEGITDTYFFTSFPSSVSQWCHTYSPNP